MWDYDPTGRSAFASASAAASESLRGVTSRTGQVRDDEDAVVEERGLVTGEQELPLRRERQAGRPVGELLESNDSVVEADERRRLELRSVRAFSPSVPTAADRSRWPW